MVFHCIFRSKLRLASVRDPNQGIQIPMTVTEPKDVRVTPATKRPGGIESSPTSSTCTQGSLDQSITFRRSSLTTYP